jgi:5-methylcytosine-specific restriction endonuclease McrBC GTP-binding regulatory subunit McrB
MPALKRHFSFPFAEAFSTFKIISPEKGKRIFKELPQKSLLIASPSFFEDQNFISL